MKNLKEITAILTDHKSEIELKFKVKTLRIFGSYVRGDYTPQSDLDIIVDFTEPVGFGFIRLADYLEKILDMPVHLTTEDVIKPNRMSYVKEHIITIFC
jgi:predicted nucleotidyltransferase